MPRTSIFYLPGAVRTAVEYLTAHQDIDVVYGEDWWIDDQGAVIRRYPTLPFDPKVLERDCFICQPASFLRASSYKRCGLDPDINHAFDYDLWIRMAKHNFRFASTPNTWRDRGCTAGVHATRSQSCVPRFHGAAEAALRLRPVFLGIRIHRVPHGRARQFFQPLEPSLLKYLVSLPMGLR